MKNSWGAGGSGFPSEGSGTWGIVDENGNHTGLFWLSYYDQTASGPVSYVVEENDEGVNITDQHDYMPVGDALSFFSDEEMKMGNIFTASHCEELEDVSCFTSKPGMTVKYEIYLLDGYSKAPEEGLKVAEMETTYRYGGYHLESLKDFDVLFISGGDDEGYPERTAPVVEAEQKLGVNVIGYHHPGFHVWDVWRFSAREFMQRIFK